MRVVVGPRTLLVTLLKAPKTDLSGQALPLHNARRTLPLHLRPFQTSGSGSSDITILPFLSKSIGDQGLTFVQYSPYSKNLGDHSPQDILGIVTLPGPEKATYFSSIHPRL